MAVLVPSETILVDEPSRGERIGADLLSRSLCCFEGRCDDKKSAVLRIEGSAGGGVYNGGRIADKELDAKIDAMKTETDPAKRDALINDALKMTKDNFYTIPVHHQIFPWAMRKGIDTVYRADARPIPAWTTIK